MADKQPASKAKKPAYKAFVVPETHWDREWYSTFQQFRILLVRLTDRLLDILDRNKRYSVYTFDGQTVVLEDYLQIRPENRARIEKHVRSGRLLVGPWYVLPDEFLISAEALVRNLMLGHRIGAGFGGVNRSGYVPDPFGHLSQLPQVMAGFGIDHVILTRGCGDGLEATEFRWESPDGTSVIAVHQVNSYGNFARPPDHEEQLVEYAQHTLDRLKPHQTTRNALFNNGVDHVEPYPRLPEYIDILNRRIPEAEFVHASFEDYYRAVKASRPKLAVHKGELRGGKFHPLLPGTLSARMQLKRENDQCQTLMERWAEPSSALAWALAGKEYPAAFLWQAWKYILQNHPHDSICGCSIDEVHQDMPPRFKAAAEIGRWLAHDNLADLARRTGPAPDPGSGRIVVFNTAGAAGSELVEVDLPAEVKAPIRVRDDRGAPVPHVLLKEKELRRIRFQADGLPCVGYKSYSVDPAAAGRELRGSLVKSGDILENEYLTVKVNADGGFNLFCKTTGKTYKNLHVFEDVADAGDEYDFSPVKGDKPLTTAGLKAGIEVLESSALRGSIRVSLNWRLPRSLTRDRKGRTSATAALGVESELSLAAGARRLEVRTRIKNASEDHRLRVLFPTGIRSETSFAESVFDVVERDVRPPKTKGWVQPPQPCQPQQGFVDITDGGRGLAVLNKGLPEFEIIRTGRGNVIAVTLIRAVGWLSRGDLVTRDGNAGPHLYTPEAQMIGDWEFEYAVFPHEGGWETGGVPAQTAAYKAPPKAFPVWGTDKPEAGADAGKLPARMEFLKVGPDPIALTALKGFEGGRGVVARIYNASTRRQTASLRWARPGRFSLLNLNEEPIKGAKLQVGKDRRTVKLRLRPFEIATVLWEKQE